MVGNIGSTLTRVVDYFADFRPIAAVSTIFGHDPAREGWGFGEPSGWWRGGADRPGPGGLPPGHGGTPPGQGGTPPGQAGKTPVEQGQETRPPATTPSPQPPKETSPTQQPPRGAEPAVETPRPPQTRPETTNPAPDTGVGTGPTTKFPGVDGRPTAPVDGAATDLPDGDLPGLRPGGGGRPGRGDIAGADPLQRLGQKIDKGMQELAKNGEAMVRGLALGKGDGVRGEQALPAGGIKADTIDPRDPGVVRLVDRARYAGGIDQGRALHDLDRLTGVRDTTNAMVRGDIKNLDGLRLQAPMNEAALLRALFGLEGPKAAHIAMGMLADGLLAATLGKVAGLDPQIIRDAIRPNERTQGFEVTLFNARGHASTIAISPEELRQHAQKLGTPALERLAKGEASWPLVMEAALAKAGDPGVSQAIRVGRDPLVHPWQWDGRTQRRTEKNPGEQSQKRSSDAKRQMMRMMAERMAKKLDTGKELKASPRRKADGVVTQALSVREGLNEQATSDGYIVQGMWQDSQGEWQVRLRNPWSTTRLVGVSPDVPIADVTVPLSTLTARGAFEFVEA